MFVTLKTVSSEVGSCSCQMHLCACAGVCQTLHAQWQPSLAAVFLPDCDPLCILARCWCAFISKHISQGTDLANYKSLQQRVIWIVDTAAVHCSGTLQQPELAAYLLPAAGTTNRQPSGKHPSTLLCCTLTSLFAHQQSRSRLPPQEAPGGGGGEVMRQGGK